MVNKAKVWTELVTIPTYQVGKVDTNPIFLEKRVYQGSSGAVYPYGVIDAIENEKKDQQYHAVFIENDFIYVMFLPELGGRIHKAYDKINRRDFVYCNDVIKPALVGLIGPWISGGIEFNWPQHHRPTTYMPVDVKINELADGSAEVWLGEVEHMYGLQVSTGFKLYKDKALIEITGRVYNRNSTPQQFLWWANPAVKGGDDHQSIFPPDVTAVYDHGKRDVSNFPIATGTYYKVDYSAGVDISRYKNLPVPTSYMAAKSDYNFVGAYSHDEKGGLLHVANHHISPGKKQWSWGNCDFGLAWDKQLTDHNGPYIELMTGVFTDNQPDFTWIDSNEEKHFIQNFLPYSELGIVHQANTDLALNLVRDGDTVRFGIYAISNLEYAVVIVKNAMEELHRSVISVTPCMTHFNSIHVDNDAILTIEVVTQNGKRTLSYTEHQSDDEATPDPAIAPQKAAEVATIEELYFIGQHLEQYHHATSSSEDYYLEALKRDKFDYRVNVAMANHELERCCYERAIEYADNALQRAHSYNKNPLCGKASLIRGHANTHLGQLEAAYADFYKSTWSGNCNDAGFLAASKISFKQKRFLDALDEVERSLEINATSYEATFVKLATLRMLNDDDAMVYADEAVKKFPLGYAFAVEKYLLDATEHNREALLRLTQSRQVNVIHLAEMYLSLDLSEEVATILDITQAKGASVRLIQALVDNKECHTHLRLAEEEFKANVLFPNTAIEVKALRVLAGWPFADYLLGCFHYAKKSYDLAVQLWQQAIDNRPDFKEAHRNLAIYHANKTGNTRLALDHMLTAWNLDQTDARVLYELDDLRKITGVDPVERLSMLEPHANVIVQRDDLVTEYITLLNINQRHEEALQILREKTFAPWEGGEGRVTGQYVNALIRKAVALILEGDFIQAKETLISALDFPENLSEGRLVGQTDNDIYYLLGLIERGLGHEDQAAFAFQKALQGDTALTEGMYYNDMPVDYLLYQCLAAYQLGKHSRAVSQLNRMKDWAREQSGKEVSHDFFAVSLPQLNVFDRDIQINNQSHCKFVNLLAEMGLCLIGEMDNPTSVGHAKAALLALEPGHAKASLLGLLSKINLIDLS